MNGPRWLAQDATERDDPELLELFEEVFGHAMPVEQWNWKYAGAQLRGTLLRRDGKVVAFYGGMPRDVQGPERVHRAVQNGDVMVKPGERGVFTRRGAFYHVTSTFLGQYLGPGRKYEFGIGFPNERHLQLGAKLGLYIEGARMLDLSWTPLPAGVQAHWTLREDVLHDGEAAVLDRLWQSMAADWHGLFIPVRDARRWRFRFFEHPTTSYTVLLVRRRFTRTPLAAVALREHASHVDWLDYIGTRAALPLARAAARRFARDRGGKSLMALCSETVAPELSPQAAAVKRSDIVIPLQAPEPGWPQPYPWQGKLWLMGGDTDFL